MPPKKASSTKADAKPAKAEAAANKSSKRVASKKAEFASPIAERPKKAPVKSTTTKTSEKPATKKTESAAPARARPKKMSPGTTTVASRKRKAESVEAEPSLPKKPRVIATPKIKAVKAKVVINEAPKVRLNVFVCGEGSSGELGLGAAKNVIDVKRPRLNQLLAADKVGVVQVAVGGMHCVALTHDNKIFTWGVNDQGALGRETSWDGGLKDVDADSDSDDDDDDSGLNPIESTPTAIPSTSFPEGTVFVQVAAADSASFALTDDGKVYGWGTFRSNDGILGFDESHRVQNTPLLISDLKKIKQLVCGANHVLALDHKGAVFSWGSGQQNQLGRRIVERTKMHGLQPRPFGLPKNIVHIGSGSYHSFAIQASGKVYAWGLNSFGATALREGAGDDGAAVVKPLLVESLTGRDIVQISGGSHHSIACTSKGECLVWGRLDGFQSGLKIDTLPDESVIKDPRGHPRILIEPTQVPGIAAKFVAASSDHSLAIDADGRAWSWGFSATYQTGQGTQDDIEVATVIDNTATRGKKLNWAGAGGQFSVFTEPASV
ncbi:Ran exchange factor Prp20/Pim1 [Penicillium taxi]|uniref:Ran exchange factor Prp20/Pim1 n=1 Tax=Penicillium taxi TaxID=168475 RepID=UPI002544E20E|nr:Ran exchange factor Prp20/Pim1 [Penicillium taxi]KAJ5895473.1 Ran exchange factor Prp20/Pim1 [Penicillium taxi]